MYILYYRNNLPNANDVDTFTVFRKLQLIFNCDGTATNVV